MGLKLVVLDPTPDCPASSVAHQTVGSFRNRDDIRCVSRSGTWGGGANDWGQVSGCRV